MAHLLRGDHGRLVRREPGCSQHHGHLLAGTRVLVDQPRLQPTIWNCRSRHDFGHATEAHALAGVPYGELRQRHGVPERAVAVRARLHALVAHATVLCQPVLKREPGRRGAGFHGALWRRAQYKFSSAYGVVRGASTGAVLTPRDTLTRRYLIRWGAIPVTGPASMVSALPRGCASGRYRVSSETSGKARLSAQFRGLCSKRLGRESAVAGTPRSAGISPTSGCVRASRRESGSGGVIHRTKYLYVIRDPMTRRLSMLYHWHLRRSLHCWAGTRSLSRVTPSPGWARALRLHAGAPRRTPGTLQALASAAGVRSTTFSQVKTSGLSSRPKWPYAAVWM